MILYLAEMNPLTAMMLVALGFFQSLRKAQRRLKKLCERGKLKFCGWAQLVGQDGVQKVYCRKRIRPDDLVHDVEVTLIVLGIKADEVVRYTAATLGKRLQPDARIVINGAVFALEHDRDTDSIKGLRDKVDRYVQAEKVDVLWVTANEARLRKIVKVTEKIHDRSAFALVSEAVHNPQGAIWRLADGSRTALPAAKSPAWPCVPAQTWGKNAQH